ncbi:MAG: chromosomal replication initiator protein DnaA [Bacteroidetes bacterium]|nr:chromosomal replication initiator protein DnaA [Bacteroidota bacterium]
MKSNLSEKTVFMVNATDARDVWQKCLSIIKKEITVQTYKTWFEPIAPVSLTGNELMVLVPSKFHYEWIESHFVNILRKSITQTLGASSILKYQIARDEDEPEVLVPEGRIPDPVSVPDLRSPASNGNRISYGTNPKPLNDDLVPNNLNEKYTFDTFIKGDSNQLARAAAFAVSENPGSNSFNPLFIYGGVGLGKTHLIQAIGNRVSKSGKVKNILYVSSERFTVDFVNSIQHNRVSEFSTFYRNVDLLIVDDVQFFSGKEKTQEEFFHIFNTLHQSGKQIVLTSDRPPKDMKFFEERLLSRFQWGLAADIQAPDLETRIAILNHKAAQQEFVLDSEVIEFIAVNVTNNVRQLEGCLVKLMAQASLTGASINLGMARDALRDIIKPSKINLSIESIQRIVSEYFGISHDLLIDGTRKQEIVRARQIAMYLAKEFTQSSLKTIGNHFGRRDHTTVIHSCESVKNQAETNDKYKKTLDDIRRKIEMSM